MTLLVARKALTNRSKKKKHWSRALTGALAVLPLAIGTSSVVGANAPAVDGNGAGAKGGCPTDYPPKGVYLINSSGCGTTMDEAVGQALVAASGVVCENCEVEEGVGGDPCKRLVAFDGVVEDAFWFFIDVEIGGFKVTYYCFTGATIVGTLDVDCDKCP